MKILFIALAFAPPICNGQYTAATIAKIDSLFHTVFKSGEPGGAVLIAKEGKVIYQKGFGIADISTRETITTKTLFNVGSISKTFVAYGILKLAAQGKLSLSDNLYKYFPGFKNREIAEKVKLYHLLTHSSGLPDSRKIKEDSVFYLTAKDEGSWNPIKLTEKLNFEPGERFEYSNPAFNGLALVIEKITGKKWQRYIEETIYKPSGMKLSTITDGPHPDKGVSHGYLFDGKKFYEKDYGEEPTFPAAGNGGVWSSAEELWKYEQAIQGNVFIDSAWINKSRTVFPLPGWKDKKPSFMGLSWFITKLMNHGMIGHTGSQGGFISDYVWLPDENFFYVLLCNTPKPIEEIRKRLLHIIQ